MRSRSRSRSSVLRHFERGNFGFGCGRYSSVFQSSASRTSFPSVLALLVEAAVGLVAQPLALEHLVDERRHLPARSARRARWQEIRDHVARTSSPTRSTRRKVPDSASRRPPVSASTSSMVRSSSCISRTAFSMMKTPMRLAMKLGVSRAKTTSLPRRTSAKCAMASMAAAVGFRRGNDLHQPHVARRVEEVRAKPAPPHVLRQSGRDRCHRQTAGIGGIDRAQECGAATFCSRARLIARFSVTASITQSQSASRPDRRRSCPMVTSAPARLVEGRGLGLLAASSAGSRDLVARFAIGSGGTMSSRNTELRRWPGGPQCATPWFRHPGRQPFECA